MKTQAWGWLTAAVLAAGLNASYHDGRLEWAHRIADQVEHSSAAVLALADGRADQFLTEARLLTARNETASCRWGAAVAQVQNRVARAENRFAHAENGLADAENGFADVEAMSAERESQFAQWQANRARIEAQVAAQTARLHVAATALTPEMMRRLEVPVICPRVRVHIPRLPMLQIPAPEVHVETGTGPV